MILVLNILDHNKGTWSVLDKKEIKYSHQFVMIKGEDSLLLHLDKFLQNNQLTLKSFTNLALTVKEASLTQVKIFTAIINTLGWQFNIPVLAEYYYSGQLKDVLVSLLKKLSKQTKFKALKVKYKQAPDITISTKHPKYKIIK